MSDSNWLVASYYIRLTNIQTHSFSDKTSVVLVANKCDREDYRLVPTMVGEKLADTLGNVSSSGALS